MSTRMNRRKFLAAAGVGGAAAAVVVVSGKDVSPKEEKSQASAQGRGYQVTAHVRRYYETTKV